MTDAGKPRGPLSERRRPAAPVAEPVDKVINGAPSQLDRAVAALVEGAAPVDGRTLAARAEFAPPFGALINFFEVDDRVEGNWEPFFSEDATIGLGSLATVEPALVERRLGSLVATTRAARDPEAKLAGLRQVFRFVALLARGVDGWLRAAQLAPPRSRARHLVGPLVRAIDEEAGVALRELVAAAKAAAVDLAAALSGLVPRWQLTRLTPATADDRGGGTPARIDQTVDAVAALAAPFLDLAIELQPAAREALAETLATGDHAPQAALFLAFADLFGTSQAVLDTFAARLAAFYREQVLREGRAGAIPDQVYLTFELAEDEGVTRETVPAGTLFPAGEDAAGHELLYASETSLVVSAARLAALRTLRRVAGPLLVTVPHDGRPAPSDLLVSHREYFAGEIAVAADDASPPPFATFGLATSAATERVVSTPARLGFAFASPYLTLAGGRRTVALEIVLTAASVAALEPLVAELALALGVGPSEAFDALLARSFRLRVTTADGWLALDGYTAASDLTEGKAFTLSFELPASAPAVAPLTPDPEAPPVDPTPSRVPTLQAELVPGPLVWTVAGARVRTWPWPYFAELEVTALRCHVDVCDLPGVAVTTTDGEVAPDAPYPAFGSVPVVGSYLEVAHPELFVKVPERLEISFDWFGLPPNDDGFVGYYRDYRIGLDGKPQPDLFDNAKFEGAWRVVEPGAWFLNPAGDICPEKALPSVPVFLFRTEPECCESPPEAAGKLCPVTKFDDLGVCPVPSGAPAYYDPANSRLRLELMAPSYTFGNDLYALNVLSSVLADLPDTNSCSEKCLAECASLKDDPVAYAACLESCLTKCLAPPEVLQYPNTPYLPTLAGLTVHYAARQELPASTAATDGAFYHLYPFDGLAAAMPSATGAAPLLPPVVAEGQLLLGFHGLTAPSNLTLLLAESADSASVGEGEAAPSWSFLTGNRWVGLGGQQILFDGTHGLTGTGLVGLALPACPLDGHTVLPPLGEEPDQWLRAAVETGAERYPETVQVYPHGTIARVVLEPGMGEHLATPLPAGTITAAVEELPNIATVSQPLESFGGRPPEHADGYAARVAERLRHKDRAALAWDYERLVLERFPTIWKVQALPARDAAGSPKPGHVLVVVVPGTVSQESQDPAVPRAPAALLATIAEYLAARATPFASIHVTNPNYVRITVTAALALEGTSGDELVTLEAELTRYLSPAWYDAERAARGGEYASEEDIADWLASRPEVKTLEAISFAYDPPRESLPWYFLTSAASHVLYPAGTVPPDPGTDPCRGATP
ncbi:MAG: baseplate J/gp47 family protein [Thermoanaerobaculia bacterium]|nr:baseplate J/gp47 family protein [Thermoanaerobaculia bacterium]